MIGLLNNFLDFFLPAFCTHCKTKLNPEEILICRECLHSIKNADKQRIESEYGRKFKPGGFVEDFTSAFIFEKDGALQSLIHALKYENKFRAGIFLGSQFAKERGYFLKENNIQFIVPVPLHRLKKAERGYNQAYYISKGIGRSLDLAVRPGILKRKKYTRTQTKMNLEERKENVRDAFILKKKKSVKNKNILIIDDVITTGATTNECAKILKEGGAGLVFAGSIALAD